MNTELIDIIKEVSEINIFLKEKELLRQKLKCMLILMNSVDTFQELNTVKNVLRGV
jgi:hypothetical protein